MIVEEDNSITVGESKVDLSRISIDYKLQCLLGNGNFGAVFKAKHRLSGVEIAIKICDKDKKHYNQVKAVLNL